jgi:hypothetical protein
LKLRRDLLDEGVVRKARNVIGKFELRMGYGAEKLLEGKNEKR